MLLRALVVLCAAGAVSPSAIPIWEMLTYQEKMGRLMYLYTHIVERYCKYNSSPDCRKVMSLHGISNLLGLDENTLDMLDPDQRDASHLVWRAATKSQFKFPPEKNYGRDNSGTSSSDYEPSVSNSDEPPRIVVPAPKFLRRTIWRY